jgi:two-component system copper resistance phosphate regulon response regulator CusR
VRVLVAEDDEGLREVLVLGLSEAGYHVDAVERGDDAIDYLTWYEYDVAVIDWRMPGAEGIDVVAWARKHDRPTALLMLTARDTPADRIQGLDSGADDYLVKPFDFGELLARLRALIRRGRQPLLPERVTVGPLMLDTRSRRVRVRNRDVFLTAKEYALLEYLVRRAGDVVSRGDIAEHVWDEHYDPVSNVVDVYVQRLRRKLDQSGSDSLIRTRRGEGYQLVSRSEG